MITSLREWNAVLLHPVLDVGVHTLLEEGGGGGNVELDVGLSGVVPLGVLEELQMFSFSFTTTFEEGDEVEEDEPTTEVSWLR